VPIGDLVFANVIDVERRAAQGDMGASVVEVRALPARALPFAVVRDWKCPTGQVAEEVELITPSGMVAHRIGPTAQFMFGSMDLTHLETIVEDAIFTEAGGHLASFRLDGEIVAQVDFAVVQEAVPAKLSQPYEDGLKRSDVIWVGLSGTKGARDRTVPAWFAYKNGKIYVLSQREPGPDEQTIPGIPGSAEITVVTRKKGQNTSLERFMTTARDLRGDEWEEAAKILVDRRRSRVGPPQESIDRWRETAAIAELTPVVAG